MKMIKRLFTCLLALAMLFSMAPLSLPAQAATSGYYTYTVTDGKATITSVNTAISGNITIPSTLGGYPVTAIDDYAFAGCRSLTSITLPKGVTSIDNYLFTACDSLTGIWVDSNNAKYSSDSNGVLFNKDKTTLLAAPGAMSDEYVIPNSVTSIGNSAFSNCTSLTSITSS